MLQLCVCVCVCVRLVYLDIAISCSIHVVTILKAFHIYCHYTGLWKGGFTHGCAALCCSFRQNDDPSSCRPRVWDLDWRWRGWSLLVGSGVLGEGREKHGATMMGVCSGASICVLEGQPCGSVIEVSTAASQCRREGIGLGMPLRKWGQLYFSGTVWEDMVSPSGSWNPACTSLHSVACGWSQLKTLRLTLLYASGLNISEIDFGPLLFFFLNSSCLGHFHSSQRPGHSETLHWSPSSSLASASSFTSWSLMVAPVLSVIFSISPELRLQHEA